MSKRKMSLTTFFQFTHTSQLALPPPATQRKAPDSDSPSPHDYETSDQISARGIATAVQMLHSPELIIMLNPLVQHYTRINPFELKSEEHLVDLGKLAPAFNVTLASPPNVSRWEDSRNGEFVHYEIVDKFQFLGGLASRLMTYRACFRPLYDAGSRPSTGTADGVPTLSQRTSIGTETISDPGSGVSLLGKWIVKDSERPGFLTLEETVSVHCNVLLSRYVKSQLESAHASLHKEFGRHFVERMMDGDPMRGKDERRGKTWKENERDEMVKRTESAARRERATSRSETGSQPVSSVGTNEM